MTTELSEFDLRADRRRLSRVFWGAFALLMVLTSVWALATPIASGPDENAHIIKAASVVRGELRGESAPDNPGAGVVEVPALFAQTLAFPVCFAFQGDQPAGCAPELLSGAKAADYTEASTWMIRNNPAYYAVVGLPTLLPPGGATIYLMRIISAAMSSLVLAWGFRSLAEVTRRSWPIVGAATAITPMAVYLNSTVNNSSLEISTAFALWMAVLALVRAPDARRVTARCAAIAVLTVVLMNTRGLAPLYVAAIIFGAAVVVGPWRPFWEVMRDRRSWPWIGVIALGTVPALWWTLGAGTLDAGGTGGKDYAFFSTAHRMFFDTGDFLIASIGRFGWFDTHLPMLVYISLAAVYGLPILLVVAAGSRRDKLAMWGMLAIAVFGPVVVQAWQAHSVGYIWTARYSMPLFVGVAAAAGYLNRDAFATVPAWLSHRIAGAVVWLASGGIFVALLVTLRRYTVGDTGSWRRIFSGDWVPDVPVIVLLVVAAAALIAGSTGLLRLRDTPERTPASDLGAPSLVA